jgi:hypothetical protein
MTTTYFLAFLMVFGATALGLFLIYKGHRE